MQYQELLRLLDGNAFRVQVKGSTCYASFTTVYITSSVPPEMWYTRGEINELMRRIKHRGGVEKMEAPVEGGEVEGGELVPSSEVVGNTIPPPRHIATGVNSSLPPLRRQNAAIGQDLEQQLGLYDAEWSWGVPSGSFGQDGGFDSGGEGPPPCMTPDSDMDLACYEEIDFDALDCDEDAGGMCSQ